MFVFFFLGHFMQLAHLFPVCTWCSVEAAKISWLFPLKFKKKTVLVSISLWSHRFHFNEKLFLTKETLFFSKTSKPKDCHSFSVNIFSECGEKNNLDS